MGKTQSPERQLILKSPQMVTIEIVTSLSFSYSHQCPLALSYCQYRSLALYSSRVFPGRSSVRFLQLKVNVRLARRQSSNDDK